LATVAVSLLVVLMHTPIANAQIFNTGVGRCVKCGHSELDTQRYVNSFLNQLFFPRNIFYRGAVAGNLYLLVGTFTMHGSRSPDSDFASVTIAITAEVKNALPTGNYHVSVTTPGGKTSKEIYVIGVTRFSVDHDYEPGAARDVARGSRANASGRTGSPHTPRYRPRIPNHNPAKCSRSRREDRGNETIVWCSIG
jgi:hypothetical protein